jgi:hypothetical protein
MKNKINKNNIWEIENRFYHNSSVSRLAKVIYHYEIYKKIRSVKGDFLECGVFKGVSLIRFASFIKIFEKKKRNLYAFDAFGSFPSTSRKEDLNFAQRHNKNLGNGIKINSLAKILKNKNINNFKLFKGNVIDTIPEFLKIKKNKKLKISILHLDVDVYVATKYILDTLYPYVVKNGIILIDDYKHVSGATRAVNEFLKKNKKLKIEKFTFPSRPSFIIKK